MIIISQLAETFFSKPIAVPGARKQVISIRNTIFAQLFRLMQYEADNNR